MPMTTVLCLHAAVAQKSYGTEKRFLCPPPVVHIEGPVWQLKQQQLSMAVVHDGGERGFEQKAPLDSSLTASFKFLHVGGTAKAKSFQLTLDIAEPSPPAPDGTEQGRGRVWASFESAPVTIISKPSKKTAKTRNISSCILAGGPVSLFNRINSQTVRTKYMTVDHTQLCASNVSWSAFNVNVLKTTAEEPPPIAGPQPVTYGSEILLVETATGIQSPSLTIRKVDKGRIVMDDNGPVSQMQKVALERKESDGSRHYLSAAGPLPGTPGAVVAPAAGIANGSGGTHPLVYQAARVREEFKDGQNRIYDEVDDYLCWTIVGISKFQYTFFDAFGQNSTIPDIPITPFPTLFTTPHYRMTSNTLELTTANFFYEDPRTKRLQPLDIYVGNLGPLRFRVFPSANNQLLTNINEPWLQPPGVLPEPNLNDRMAAPHSRYVPMGPSYTIIVVEMPPMQEVLKALLEDALGSRDVRSSEPGNSESAGSSAKVDPNSLAGRSLPLLFIRTYDGVGYHSGRAVQAENVFQNIDLRDGSNVMDGSFLAAATQAANAAMTVDGGLHGWALRVI